MFMPQIKKQMQILNGNKNFFWNEIDLVGNFRRRDYETDIGFGGKRGVRSVENTECGKCRVWKMRSVENAGCRKCGVWKMRGVENAGCGKCGVWKMRRKFQFSVSLCHPNVDKQCVSDKKK